MPDPLDALRHLWDGSEPGWHLLDLDNVAWSLFVCFGEGGPALAEVVALRRVFPLYGERPAREVLFEVRGKGRVVAGHNLGNIESRTLAERAREAGLVVELRYEQRGGLFPVSPAGDALIIEDKALEARVVAEMLAAGVPVSRVHVD